MNTEGEEDQTAVSSFNEAHSPSRPDGAFPLLVPPGNASDQNPAFSPEGTQLVFTRFEEGYNDGPAGLFLLDLSDGLVSRATPVEDQDNVNLPGSAWVRDGGIVFASDREASDDLWALSPGYGLQRLTHHVEATIYLEPSWSPDGQWIVFEVSVPGHSEDGRIGHIWKVRLNGQELTQLTGDASYDDRQPNWSPAGDRILFQRRVLPEGNWDLYTMRPDGSLLLNVSASPDADDTDASWSPDGGSIVFSSDLGGLSLPNLFLILSEGGPALRATWNEKWEDSAPSWSPDGSWLAFESHADEVEPASLWGIGVADQLHEGINRDDG